MAYLFQASILTGSGGYDVTGPISASTTITATSFHGSGASLTGISADAVDVTGSSANVDLNLLGTDRYDTTGKAALAGGAAKILVFNPTSKALKCSGSISGAAGLSGASLTINNTVVASQAGALRAITTVSGAGQLSGQNLVLENGSITAAGAFSGSANANFGGSLIAGTTVSGAGGVSGQALTISNIAVVAAGGGMTLGGSAAVDITCNGVFKLQNGWGINYVLTGSGTGTALQGNAAPLGSGDTFVVVHNSSTEATVELPYTTGNGWYSGRIVTIKRSPDMSADVILSGALGANGGLLDGEDATLRLDSAGAAVNLLASGSSGDGAYWLLY